MINLAFKGDGRSWWTSSIVVVHEPDYIINILTVAKTRTASVVGVPVVHRPWWRAAVLGLLG